MVYLIDLLLFVSVFTTVNQLQFLHNGPFSLILPPFYLFLCFADKKITVSPFNIGSNEMQSSDSTISSSNSRSSGPGTITYNPFVSLPIPPNIVAEWTALIPLVAHLASYRHDHQLAGEAALSGRLNVSLFPRLGVLDGIARLLAGGPDFLDRVSTLGEVNRHVWDVNWGSSFPCANGAASSIITAYALGCAGSTIIRMPEHVAAISKIHDPEQSANGTSESLPVSMTDELAITAKNTQTAKNTTVGAMQRETCALFRATDHNQI